MPDGSYSVRVIGLGASQMGSATAVFPALVAGGRTTSVVSGGITSVTVSLSVPSVMLVNAPATVNAGSQFSVTVNITDPADFLAGVYQARLWVNDQQVYATLTRGNGAYSGTWTLKAPTL